MAEGNYVVELCENMVRNRDTQRKLKSKMESANENVLNVSYDVNDPSNRKRCNYQLILLVCLVAILVAILTIVFTHRSNPKVKESEDGDEGDPVVQTAKGKLKGIREHSVGGQPFLSFYAIPFASPPTGRLRFQDPLEEDAWTGVRNASSQPEKCIQISFRKLQAGIISEESVVGSEDCLYLNVFTPKVGVSELLPVMVFLHGGGYQGGGAYQYEPHVLLDHQVVLVVPQFRVAALAFMSTEDDVMSGNYMLKDQLAALRWVHRNIHDFGGDSHRLTLFGESSGGTSIGILSLSPKAQGLFSRVIQQSGTVLSPFAFGRRHRQVAEETARFMGYVGKLDSKSILSFLQTVPEKNLTLVNLKYYEFFVLPTVMAPRVDGDLIPADPYEMALTMPCPPWELMAGLTSHDGALLGLQFYLREELRTSLAENFAKLGPVALLLADNDPDGQTKAEAVFQYYLGTNINLELKDNFTQLHTDYGFGVPVDFVAMAHSACARPHRHTFTFELTHRGERSITDIANVTFAKNWVTHADDLYYLFNMNAFDEDLQLLTRPEDLALRDIITKLWVNFAYTGNPTPDASLGFTWEAVENGNLTYLSLALSPAMKPDYRHEVREFYRTLFPEQNGFIEKCNALKI